MKFEIVNFDGTNCLGVEKHITKEIKKDEVIKDLWTTLVDSINYQVAGDMYGISKNFNLATQEFDYLACCHEDTQVLKDFNPVKVSIPSGKYAKFIFKGIMVSENIEKFYMEVFTFSMFGGEITPDMERGINSFELYDESYLGMDNPDSIYYLLIPIK